MNTYKTKLLLCSMLFNVGMNIIASDARGALVFGNFSHDVNQFITPSSVFNVKEIIFSQLPIYTQNTFFIDLKMINLEQFTKNFQCLSTGLMPTILEAIKQRDTIFTYESFLYVKEKTKECISTGITFAKEHPKITKALIIGGILTFYTLKHKYVHYKIAKLSESTKGNQEDSRPNEKYKKLIKETKEIVATTNNTSNRICSNLTEQYKAVQDIEKTNIDLTNQITINSTSLSNLPDNLDLLIENTNEKNKALNNITTILDTAQIASNNLSSSYQQKFDLTMKYYTKIALRLKGTLSNQNYILEYMNLIQLFLQDKLDHAGQAKLNEYIEKYKELDNTNN